MYIRYAITLFSFTVLFFSSIVSAEETQGGAVDIEADASVRVEAEDLRIPAVRVHDEDSDGDGFGDPAVFDEVEKEIEIIEYQDGTAVPAQMIGGGGARAGINVELETRVVEDSEGAMGSSESDETIRILEVSGVEVRGWDSRDKEEVSNARGEMDEPQSVEEYTTWVAHRVLEDESILEITAEGEERLTVTYDTTVYLFGFIPLRAHTKAEMLSDNEVVVRMPWFAGISRAPDTARIKKTTEEIGTAYLRSQGKVKFKAGKALADTVK